MVAPPTGGYGAALPRHWLQAFRIWQAKFQ